MCGTILPLPRLVSNIDLFIAGKAWVAMQGYPREPGQKYRGMGLRDRGIVAEE